MRTPVNVVYSLSRNLYPWLKPSITSLLEHNRDAKIFILAEDDELPFEIPCEHEILNMSGQQIFPQAGPNMRSEFTYMAMLRVCTPELIQAERVIQLDVDTIVCDSLLPIWEMDLDGKWLAWCPEYFGQYKPFGPTYYNFGVAVMNLKLMRENSLPEALVGFLNFGNFPFIDQDVMNMVAAQEHSADLPVRYNESFCCGYTEHPAIVHYAGFPNWYDTDQAPRWWLREKYRKKADEVFGPWPGGAG